MQSQLTNFNINWKTIKTITRKDKVRDRYCKRCGQYRSTLIQKYNDDHDLLTCNFCGNKEMILKTNI